jgi:hypothetical protein
VNRTGGLARGVERGVRARFVELLGESAATSVAWDAMKAMHAASSARG